MCTTSFTHNLQEDIETLRMNGISFTSGASNNVTSPNITLPSELFTLLPVSGDVSLIFGTYRSPILFQRIRQGSSSSFAVASSVITASVGRSVKIPNANVVMTIPLLSQVCT